MSLTVQNYIEVFSKKRAREMKRAILLHSYKISFVLRHDPSWRGREIIIAAASQCLLHCENKSSGEYIRLYLITSGWSSQSMEDAARPSLFFLSDIIPLCIYLISRLAKSYHLFQIAHVQTRKTLPLSSSFLQSAIVMNLENMFAWKYVCKELNFSFYTTLHLHFS